MTNNEMPSHHGVEVSPTDREYPNETVRLLIERASCRNFSDEKIPADVLQLVLEAGVHAATGGNLQPYSIIKIEKVAPFTATSSFRHFWISFQDTLICAQSICTAADALGLGSVYAGTVLEYLPELREMFQLPKGVFPVVLLCLGYPKTKPQPRKKLSVGAIVHAERYHEMADQELLDTLDEKYPGHRVQITEQRLETISEVCRQVHGEEFAKRCVERIRETGYITPVQRYFGLHYRANAMPKGNDDFLKLMEEFGFNWFKTYRETTSRSVRT
jgi:FMN reductase [NAD(P)H]